MHGGDYYHYDAAGLRGSYGGCVDPDEQSWREVSAGFGDLLHLHGDFTSFAEWLLWDTFDPGSEPGADDHFAELRDCECGGLSCRRAEWEPEQAVTAGLPDQCEPEGAVVPGRLWGE